MKYVTIYETAVGPCIECGEESKGSCYWTPLPLKIWTRVLPQLRAMKLFRDRNSETCVFFIPPHSKPFCGADCSLRWYEIERRR